MPNMIIEPAEFRKMAINLLAIGYIPIFGEFNDQMEEIVIECIFKARSEKVKNLTFLINSNGGANKTFAAIKCAMVESGLEFKGLVMGQAISNGFNLLQQCVMRSAVRDAMLMFHWGSNKLGNSQLAAIIAGEKWPIEGIIKAEMVTAEQVSERTGVTMEKLKEFALYERAFLGEEAKAMNFVDEVVKDLPYQVHEALKAKPTKTK